MRLGLFLLLFGSSVAGCDEGQTLSGEAVAGIRLIDSIYSFWRLEQLEAHLRAAGYRWTVRHPPPHEPSSRRPPFQVTTVSIDRFTHLGFEGKLEIELFNGRLMSARFLPGQLDAYLKALRAQTGIALPESGEGEVIVAPHLRIRIARKPHRFVQWEDIRLVEEVLKWIKRYAKGPCSTYKGHWFA